MSWLGFLVPAFLAGLAALAIPIVIHLRHREWERPRRFPSLMFLRRIPIRTARRRRITDWLLLLLRAAVVALLVAAFTRPFFRRDEATGAGVAARAVAVLLDRSLSMGHRDLWPAALDSARSAIRGLGAEDRVAVIRFDDRAEIAQPLGGDHAAALAAVSATRPGTRGTRYAAGFRAARQVLAAAPDRLGEIVIVTDLQRSGLAGGGGGGGGGMAGLELPAGITVRVMPVRPGERGNAALVGGEVQRLPAGDRSELVVTARVASRELGGSLPRRVRLALAVDGRPAGSREVALPADGIVTASFDRVPLPPGRSLAVISLEPDALPADDTLRVVVPPETGLRVVLLVPPGSRPEETLFLERALAIGRDPRFGVERRAALDPAILRGAGVVVLFDAAPPAAAAGALEDWVRQGGGLIVAAGSRLGTRTSPLLAGSVQGQVDRMDDRGGSLGEIAVEHPVFAAFREAGTAGLGAARFLRYPRLAPAEGSQVLARFDDGNPALLELPLGSGRLLMLAAPLDNLTGDFPLQPAYLPFLRRLALHAAGHRVAPLWRTAGEVGILPGTVRDPVVATPGGALIRLGADSVTRAGEGGEGRRAVTVGLEEAGFYRLYAGRPAGDPVEVIAVNPPPAESDLTPADPRELLIGVARGDSTRTSSAALAPGEREARQGLWRWLLILVAFLLVFEAFVANRGWRGTASSVLPPLTERNVA